HRCAAADAAVVACRRPRVAAASGRDVRRRVRGPTNRGAVRRHSSGQALEPVVMSLAGGGLRHGQVIGATEADGGQIKEWRVTPGDLAATIYQHMGVPLNATYPDTSGRPRHIVENGRPIAELL